MGDHVSYHSVCVDDSGLTRSAVSLSPDSDQHAASYCHMLTGQWACSPSLPHKSMPPAEDSDLVWTVHARDASYGHNMGGEPVLTPHVTASKAHPTSLMYQPGPICLPCWPAQTLCSRLRASHILVPRAPCCLMLLTLTMSSSTQSQ